MTYIITIKCQKTCSYFQPGSYWLNHPDIAIFHCLQCVLHKKNLTITRYEEDHDHQQNSIPLPALPSS